MSNFNFELKLKTKTVKKKYPFWFYIAALLIPIVLLILLEAALRITNYGYDYSTFIKIPDKYPGLLFFNPDLPKKFFNKNAAVPAVIPDGFKAAKDINTFRIFVLGGSTTAGFPFPTNASFPRQLKRKLQLLYADKRFEVINMGVSAVNSIFIAQYIKDVLSQSPDLILIYAGHNEYYGAYGAASSGLIKGDSNILPLLFWLKDFKFYQLTENLFNYVSEFLAGDENRQTGRTLMAEMAGNRTVEYNSEEFYTGINQFKNNLEYILNQCSSANIPVIMGALTSNLLQKPLDSIINVNSDANKIFNSALIISESDSTAAFKLLTEAKDKDALRFRAPSEINDVIYEEARRFKISVAGIDSLFRSKYGNGKAGNSIFVDHLHPNIYGHQLIADEYFSQIIKQNIFDEPVNKELWSISDRILKGTFPFTRFDSTFARIKIQVLLNAYPFKKELETEKIFAHFKPINKSDSLALQAAAGRKGWTAAHAELAEYFYSRKNYSAFFNEMMTLIFDKPFDTYTYKSTAEYLKAAGRKDLAYTIISLLHKVEPSIYTLKSLGELSFYLRQYERALYFFDEAIKIDRNDPGIFLLAAKSYIQIGNKEEAEKLLHLSLKLNPDNNEARKLLNDFSTEK